MTVDGRAGVTTPVLARTRTELAAALARQDEVRTTDSPADSPAGSPAGSPTGSPTDHAHRAVVMTMGALHEGHLSLVRAARACAEHVVVTIFVNPLQFGPGEDLDRYPRDLDRDLALLTGPGLLGPSDVVFAPTPEVVYPDGDPMIRVSAGVLGGVLETVARPGHLDGVLTVVLKLMHLVRPDVALFGQKDAQQVAAVRRMVRDLDVPVVVREVETVRAADGLALSSRNAYLSADEHQRALALSRAARAAQDAGTSPGAGPRQVRAAVAAVLDGADVDLEYAELVDPDTFAPLGDVTDGPEAVFVIAARVGATRLIDTARVSFTSSVDPSTTTNQTSEVSR